MQPLLSQLAHVGATGTLVCIMVAVGLSVPGRMRDFGAHLKKGDLGRAVFLNFIWVPAWAAALARLLCEPWPDLSFAVLLFGCLPAGPISLLFVSRRAERLARSTATVLALQILCAALSPALVLGLGALTLDRLPLGRPGVALLSLASQIVALELLPIALGAWLRARAPEKAERLARGVRRLATGCLLVAAAGFSGPFLERVEDGSWQPALAPFLLLPALAWLGAWFVPGAAKVDTAQVAGLRNISLALVVAAGADEMGGAVPFVLIGAVVTTALAPVLRAATRRQRAPRPARAG